MGDAGAKWLIAAVPPFTGRALNGLFLLTLGYKLLTLNKITPSIFGDQSRPNSAL
jgi:hypothetical protein